MAERILIIIPGEPQAYRERARTFIRAKPGKRGQPVGSIGVSSYKPKHAEDYQAVVRALAIETMRERAPISGPVRLRIRAYVPIPKSMPKWQQRDARAGRHLPVKRPDLTNLLKLAEDALGEIVWKDDNQVVRLSDDSGRYYSDRPRLELEVEPIDLCRLQAAEFGQATQPSGDLFTPKREIPTIPQAGLFTGIPPFFDRDGDPGC